MKIKCVVACGVVGILAALPVACSRDRPAENPQNPYGMPSGSSVGYSPSPSSSMATPSTPATLATGQSDAGSGPPAADGGPATPTVFDAAAQELMRQQIKPLAQKYAPGMKPEGQLVGGVVAEGQTVEQQGLLMPGKCYTVVGTSMLSVQELDVQVSLITPLPSLSPVLAVDNMTGPQAIVGGHPNCYKIPPIMMLATPVKITVKAVKGAGVVGAQLYAK